MVLLAGEQYAQIKLSRNDFKTLGQFIQKELGIKMPDVKRGLVESRLRKRLSKLNMASYTDYCNYLLSDEGMTNELPDFINEITTNKTDFFREPHHFKFMLDSALPELLAKKGIGVSRKLMAWSCACSRGDEPYTLAMVLSEFARRNPGYDFSILATDISTRVLNKAVTGIYDEEIINPVPMEFRKRYLLKSKDKGKHLVRIRPELRRKVMYRQLNLMHDDYRINQKMDILFCRNVIIYFDKPTTDRLLTKLCEKLIPGGYLFMGHSELIDCNHLPLMSVAPTIYRRID